MTDPAVTAQHPPVERVTAPEAAWFRALFQEHFAYVWRALRRLGVREADLEDLAHEVFVTAYRRRDDLDPERPVRPWLFGVALRIAAGHRRLARHQNEVLDDEEVVAVDEAPLPDQALAIQEDRALVLEALQLVELNRRGVFVMHDLDGTAMPEIARVLGIPLNTAYSRLRLAREDFRAAVQRLRSRQR